MYKYGFNPKEAIAWVRLCRPGSVVGFQQQFVVDQHAGLKKLMGESGDIEKNIKVDRTNEERPYPHCAKKPAEKPYYLQKPLYKPKKFRKQLDELYAEIDRVQFDQYKVSKSGARYDTLNLVGSLKEGFNSKYNEFSKNVTVLKQKGNKQGSELDDYKEKIIKQVGRKYAPNIEHMNDIYEKQHNRVKFLASEKGKGPMKEQDTDFWKYPGPSMIGTELQYRKKDR